MKLKYRIPFIATVALIPALLIIVVFSFLYAYYTDKFELENYKASKEAEILSAIRTNVQNIDEAIRETYSKTVSEEAVMQYYKLDLLPFSVEERNEIQKTILLTTLEQQLKILYKEGKTVWIIESEAPYRIVVNPAAPELKGKITERIIEKEDKKNLWEIYALGLQKKDSMYFNYDYKEISESEYFKQYSYVQHFPQFEWIIGSEKSEKDLLQEIEIKKQFNNVKNRRLIFWISIISVVTFLLFLRLMISTGKRFTLAITFVMKSIMELARGKSIEKIEITDKHELGKMQKAINRISESFNRYINFTQALAENNMNYPFKISGNYDELGKSLINLQEKLKEEIALDIVTTTENEKRNWHSDGLELINNVLRKQTSNLDDLAYLVLKELVKYLNAGMGAIYIYHKPPGEAPYLEMIASYALEQRRLLKQKYELKEGLPGTCAQEKSTMFLTEIPDNYAKITSALGSANPKSLLFVPLKIENDIFGVIELGSFYIMQPNEIAFTESVSKSIAATISNLQINERTNKLLEQTHIQAEELALREEELRMHMEELDYLKEQLNKK